MIFGLLHFIKLLLVLHSHFLSPIELKALSHILPLLNSFIFILFILLSLSLTF